MDRRAITYPVNPRYTGEAFRRQRLLPHKPYRTHPPGKSRQRESAQGLDSTHMRPRLERWISLLAVLVLAAAACSRHIPSPPAPPTTVAPTNTYTAAPASPTTTSPPVAAPGPHSHMLPEITVP